MKIDIERNERKIKSREKKKQKREPAPEAEIKSTQEKKKIPPSLKFSSVRAAEVGREVHNNEIE